MGKVHFYARHLGHFGDRPAPGPDRPPGAQRPGGSPAGRRADRAAASSDPAALLARAGQGSGVARNTVAEAYGQLVAEGWLTARRGSGTQVADRAAAAGAPPAPAAAQASRLRYNLRPGTPDLSAFPRQEWLAAARRSLAAAPSEALGYGDPRGRLELRRALAGYLSRARGVRATTDRIVICAGFTAGFGLLCQALRARGATVLATEAYSLAVHREAAAARGLRLTTLPVDAEGAAVGEAGSADAVLLTPAHQFPLGMALAAPRRTWVVEWAARTGGLVIED